MSYHVSCAFPQPQRPVERWSLYATTKTLSGPCHAVPFTCTLHNPLGGAPQRLHTNTHSSGCLASPRPPIPPLSSLTTRAYHRRTRAPTSHHPAAVAFVPYGIVLVRVRVRVQRIPAGKCRRPRRENHIDLTLCLMPAAPPEIPPAGQYHNTQRRLTPCPMFQHRTLGRARS